MQRWYLFYQLGEKKVTSDLQGKYLRKEKKKKKKKKKKKRTIPEMSKITTLITKIPNN
jgi:hypothetical protein